LIGEHMVEEDSDGNRKCESNGMRQMPGDAAALPAEPTLAAFAGVEVAYDLVPRMAGRA